VGDPDLLPKVLAAAARFQGPPPEDEIKTASIELGMETLFS
jgi:hypothetical protein